MRTVRPYLLAFPLLALACQPRAQAAPVFALLAEAQVSAASVYLSDLLPAEAPAKIRQSAAGIVLAAAPPPGGSLTLSAQRVTAALPAMARGEVVVPPQILVHRSARPLSREEVLVALRSARFPANAEFDTASLQLDDLQFSAPVVSAADPRLEVRRANLDPALRQARFVLASSADPHSLPFLVTARLRPPVRDAAAMAGSMGTPSVARSSESELVSSALMVEPGKPARLHVFSANMQMFLDVVPLERGALHETVRVRLPGSGRVLRGLVVAPGCLEAQF